MEIEHVDLVQAFFQHIGKALFFSIRLPAIGDVDQDIQRSCQRAFMIEQGGRACDHMPEYPIGSFHDQLYFLHGLTGTQHPGHGAFLGLQFLSIGIA